MSQVLYSFLGKKEKIKITRKKKKQILSGQLRVKIIPFITEFSFPRYSCSICALRNHSSHITNLSFHTVNLSVHISHEFSKRCVHLHCYQKRTGIQLYTTAPPSAPNTDSPSLRCLQLRSSQSPRADEKWNFKREHIFSSNTIHLLFYQFAFITELPTHDLCKYILIVISSWFSCKRNIHPLWEDLVCD